MRIGKKETIIVVIIGLILVGGFVVNLLFGIGIGTFRVEHHESEGSSFFKQSDPPRDRLNDIPGYPMLAVLIGIFVAILFRMNFTS
jgi:hypothetical protein